MFYHLAPYLEQVRGPFRLLGSYLVLIGIGTTAAGLVTWFLLPRCDGCLPCDRGKVAPEGEVAKGKPTGAGVLLVLFLLPVLALVLPFSPRLWGTVTCLVLVMLTGYLDDRSITPWNEYVKGALDLAIAVATSLVLCGCQDVVIWIPFYKNPLPPVSPWLYVPLASVVLWTTINATNCSDGVDGLAGTLTLLSLFYLGGFLYLVIGHSEVSSYLLIPHNRDGARWAVLLFSSAGALAGYLWHNAEPSTILMGDAGSRFLGLLVGVAVLASGNPFLAVVVAPVVLVNGGTGIVKIVLLRLFRKLGFDVSRPQPNGANGGNGGASASHLVIHLLHRVRFPLHDHCRANLKWSNAQVLLRFVIVQAFLTPLLLVILVKVR